MTYYLGDPCYIIPDDDWMDFCEATFNEQNRAKGEGYIDSVINWHGQEIEIWSNGGDGTWTWDDDLGTTNGARSFGVDAGIFCVIDLDQLPAYENDPADMGMLFDKKPELRVDDGVVYINDEHDNSMITCDNFRCGRTIAREDTLSCHYGNCDEGCEWCFECTCCDDCGEQECECEEE